MAPSWHLFWNFPNCLSFSLSARLGLHTKTDYSERELNSCPAICTGRCTSRCPMPAVIDGHCSLILQSRPTVSSDRTARLDINNVYRRCVYRQGVCTDFGSVHWCVDIESSPVWVILWIINKVRSDQSELKYSFNHLPRYFFRMHT